jgi:hypothetical protein
LGRGADAALLRHRQGAAAADRRPDGELCLRDPRRTAGAGAGAELHRAVADADLRREIHELLADFGGDSLKLGDTRAVFVETRFEAPSMDSVRKVAALRSTLAEMRGPTFVPGPWETADPSERFRRLSRALAAALADELPGAQVAA